MSAATVTPKEFVERAFDVLNRHDLDALDELWHEDLVEDVVAMEPIHGRPAMREYFRQLFAALPDLRFEVVRITADDRAAAVQYRLIGTTSGEAFQGIVPPPGKRMELRGIDVMEVDGGRLRRNTIYFDGATFARQLGMLPPQGSPADRAMLAAFNASSRLRGRLRSR